MAGPNLYPVYFKTPFSSCFTKGSANQPASSIENLYPTIEISGFKEKVDSKESRLMILLNLNR